MTTKKSNLAIGSFSEAAVSPRVTLRLTSQILRGNTTALDKLLVHASSNTIQQIAANYNSLSKACAVITAKQG